MTDEIWRLEAEASDTMLVSFASHRARAFNFYRYAQKSGVNRLWLRDPSDNWYNTGVPTFGINVEEIAARIRSIAEEHGVKHIVMLGSSMGAYAAILFGCLIGASRVVAYSPQTLLDPRFYLSPPADVPLEVPDLAPIVEASPHVPISIVYGQEDVVDEFNVNRIAAPNVQILAVPGEWHTFTERLGGTRVEEWTNLLRNGSPPPGTGPSCAAGSAEIREAVANGVFGFFWREWPRAIDGMTFVTEQLPDWAGAHQWLARIYALSGRQADAVPHFRRASDLNPAWDEPIRHLGRTFLLMKDYAAAEPVLRQSLAMGWSAWGAVFLAECLAALGRKDEVGPLLDVARHEPGMRAAIEKIEVTL